MRRKFKKLRKYKIDSSSENELLLHKKMEMYNSTLHFMCNEKMLDTTVEECTSGDTNMAGHEHNKRDNNEALTQHPHDNKKNETDNDLPNEQDDMENLQAA